MRTTEDSRVAGKDVRPQTSRAETFGVLHRRKVKSQGPDSTPKTTSVSTLPAGPPTRSRGSRTGLESGGDKGDGVLWVPGTMGSVVVGVS